MVVEAGARRSFGGEVIKTRSNVVEVFHDIEGLAHGTHRCEGTEVSSAIVP
jgi:hypothetical protein